MHDRSRRHRLRARGRTASLAALLLLALSMPVPGLAADNAPPEITLGAPAVTTDERTLGRLTGTVGDPDGDPVTLTASLGRVELEPNLIDWRWTLSPQQDGPWSAIVTITADDGRGGLAEASFPVTVSNLAPDASTRGPALVPLGSASARGFRVRANDVDADPVTETADCGSGTLVETRATTLQGEQELRCTFSTPGATLVGIQAWDDDGGYTDARIETLPTPLIHSQADGAWVVDGVAMNQHVGGAAAMVDLNGDGRDDLVIGSTTISGDPTPYGLGYVGVMLGGGAAGARTVDALVPPLGYRIVPPAGTTQFGFAVANAGDVNGDGLDDLVIGGPAHTADDRTAAYVVYGSTTVADVDLVTLPPSRGYRILRRAVAPFAGAELAGGRDVNGDGLDDIVIGAPFEPNGSDINSGAAYLVLGARNSGTVDLADPPAGRVTRYTGRTVGPIGKAVGLGDMNADGRADVLLGAPEGWIGRVAVVFGITAPVDRELGDLMLAQGYVVEQYGGGAFGSAIAAGDVDGDGDDDLLIGAPAEEVVPGGYDSGAGIVHVLRQRPSTVRSLLPADGPAAFSILGPPGSNLGGAVAVGDLNRDGRADILAGAWFADAGGSTGSTYVVRGTTNPTTVNLRILSSGWERYDGDDISTLAGYSVAAGDLDGDGADDLVVGAPGVTNWGVSDGRVSVHRGSPTDLTPPTVSTPTVLPAAGHSVNGSRIPIEVRWLAGDAAGIARTEVAVQVDGGAFGTVATLTSGSRYVHAAWSGHHYRFKVRARDRAGNSSAWAYSRTMTASLVSDGSPSVSRTGAWSRTIGAQYVGGSTLSTSSAAARATLSFRGRGVAWVGAVGPGRGRATVYIDGRVVAAVDLHASASAHRRVVFRWTWPATGTHTLMIRPLGTAGRPRVDLDAFVVLR